MSQIKDDLNKLEAIIKKKAMSTPVIKMPDFPVNDTAEKLAKQAIASLRDSVNNNQAVMAEIAKQIGNRPKKFIIARDARGDMTEVIPVYEGDK